VLARPGTDDENTHARQRNARGGLLARVVAGG
jgi:hypothetical protein